MTLLYLTAGNVLLCSLLNYCKSLFRSLKFNLLKLQCIDNSAARIASNTSRYTNLTPALKKLRWLAVEPHNFLYTTIVVLTMPGAVRVLVSYFTKIFFMYKRLPTVLFYNCALNRTGFKRKSPISFINEEHIKIYIQIC